MPKITNFSITTFLNDPSADMGYFYDKNGEDDHVLGSLFYGGQKLDILDGYIFATNHLIAKEVDFKTFTPEDFLKKINELSTILSKHIVFYGGLGLEPGAYSPSSVSILKDSNHPTKLFNYSAEFSLQNYDILKEVYDKQEAENYKLFCQIVKRKSQQELKKLLKGSRTRKEKLRKLKDYSHNPLNIILNANLNKLASFKSYKKIIDFGVRPKDIPQQMLKAASQTLDYIKKDKPFTAATLFIREIARIHPFVNGNGRLARLIANCIIMQTGHQPVNFGLFRSNGLDFDAIVQNMLEPKTANKAFKELREILKIFSAENKRAADTMPDNSPETCESRAYAQASKPSKGLITYRIDNQIYLVNRRDYKEFLSLYKKFTSYNQVLQQIKTTQTKLECLDLAKYSVLQAKNALARKAAVKVTPDFLLNKAKEGNLIEHKVQKLYLAKLAIDMLNKAATPNMKKIAEAHMDAANYCLELNCYKPFTNHLDKALAIIEANNLNKLKLRAVQTRLQGLLITPYEDESIQTLPKYVQELINDEPSELPRPVVSQFAASTIPLNQKTDGAIKAEKAQTYNLGTSYPSA